MGIVLGSVGGFILLFYLLTLCLGFPGATGRSGSFIVEEEVFERRSRSSRSRRGEMAEVIETRKTSPPRRMRREDNDAIIVEEETGEESVVTRSEDVIEVEEEEDDEVEDVRPPPVRTRSSRISGSYRTVDPYEYGGGGSRSSRFRR